MQQHSSFSGHPPPTIGQWSGPPFMYRSAAWYNRLVTITLAKLLAPPRMKSYAWALRRLPPSAQRIATVLHTIVTSLPGACLFLATTAPCCAVNHPSIVRLACPFCTQIPITRRWARRSQAPHESRLVIPCLLLKKATGQGVMQCNMRSGFLKLKIIITVHSRRD
jgi:hypothetical protein